MGYIALLVAVLVGGAVAFYNGWGGVPSNGQTALKELSAPIEAAEEAVAAIEARMGTETIDEGTTTAKTATPAGQNRQTMLVAGGCFWCVEADLEKLPGVIGVVSGYTGGNTSNPTYQNYSNDGHREVVEVTYDSSKVSFEEILVYAMKHMDPTDDDGSFGDRGEYYSPAFYYKTPVEKIVIETLLADVDSNGPYPKPLAIDIEMARQFYAAEDYHQDYYKGALSKLKYQYYRSASGRDAYISKIWGDDTGPTLPWRSIGKPESVPTEQKVTTNRNTTAMWQNYVKPSKDILKTQMEELAFTVTQEEGTERAGTSPLDKNYERGIYVDVLSQEPLFSSKDKFDSGTGWPSFVRPITPEAVTEHVDRSFFSSRTEIRSAIADNHLGHVFNDGPRERGGMRYCMNGVALRFVAEADMEAAGYGEYISSL